MPKYNIDAIDQKILMHLISNARMPFLEIARECGISGAAIHQRVKKLEEAGIITGSRLEINPKARISEPNISNSVIDSLKSIPEIVECHFITGKYTLFLKVFCTDNEHLMNVIINTIQGIPGITQTETFLSLDQSFERQVNVGATRIK